MENLTPAERAACMPTIHIISDSVGVTAQAVAKAAAAQFGVMEPKIEILPKVKSFAEIKRFLEEHVACHVDTLGDDRLLVFYTLVHSDMRDELSAYIAQRDNIEGVDIMTGAIRAISDLSGMQPTSTPGTLRAADASYLRRIEAVEFTIEHDDGRNPQDITRADLVILGVSRSSKTPLSIFLAQQWRKVANIPRDPTTDVPKELFDVDPTRIFGLMTTPEVLSDIRIRRLGNARGVASEYADIEYIYQDLESARALMRKLGCIVVHTEKKAVEETAQEILRYYERCHPSLTGIIE